MGIYIQLSAPFLEKTPFCTLNISLVYSPRMKLVWLETRRKGCQEFGKVGGIGIGEKRLSVEWRPVNGVIT